MREAKEEKGHEWVGGRGLIPDMLATLDVGASSPSHVPAPKPGAGTVTFQ